MTYRRVDVDGATVGYVRDTVTGRRIADRLTFATMRETAQSIPVDRIPQGAVRLDAGNRSGSKSYR